MSIYDRKVSFDQWLSGVCSDTEAWALVYSYIYVEITFLLPSRGVKTSAEPNRGFLRRLLGGISFVVISLQMQRTLYVAYRLILMIMTYRMEITTSHRARCKPYMPRKCGRFFLPVR